MKKKVLRAILPLCVAMVMTACDGNTDTPEAEKTATMAESAEADAQAEEKAEEQAQEEEKAEEQVQAEEEAEEQASNVEADACYEAGRKSLYGLDGAEINIEDAYTNFTKAQELGNTDANFYLGVLTDCYDYPRLDYEQARAYYEQCGDNPYAQIALGCLYYHGDGVEQDKEKGKELFQAAADQGAVEGYYGFAMVSEMEDFETALEYYNKVVEEGTEQFYIASAMMRLGNMCNMFEMDGVKAIEWYTKAADLGNTVAMVNLGFMYEHGNGVEQDSAKAIEWYTKAADLGAAYAMCYLGDMYQNGEGVEQDSAKAIDLLTQAADLGNAFAMSSLGDMYQNGEGVEPDAEKAAEWYAKAEGAW